MLFKAQYFLYSESLLTFESSLAFNRDEKKIKTNVLWKHKQQLPMITKSTPGKVKHVVKKKIEWQIKIIPSRH